MLTRSAIAIYQRVVSELVSIVSLLISRLLLSVKLHLTLRLNLMFGIWQAILEHASLSSRKLHSFQLPSSVIVTSDTVAQFVKPLHKIRLDDVFVSGKQRCGLKSDFSHKFDDFAEGLQLNLNFNTNDS